MEYLTNIIIIAIATMTITTLAIIKFIAKDLEIVDQLKKIAQLSRTIL